VPQTLLLDPEVGQGFFPRMVRVFFNLDLVFWEEHRATSFAVRSGQGHDKSTAERALAYSGFQIVARLRVLLKHGLLLDYGGHWLAEFGRGRLIDRLSVHMGCWAQAAVSALAHVELLEALERFAFGND